MKEEILYRIFNRIIIIVFLPIIFLAIIFINPTDYKQLIKDWWKS